MPVNPFFILHFLYDVSIHLASEDSLSYLTCLRIIEAFILQMIAPSEHPNFQKFELNAPKSFPFLISYLK
ncbi:Uncharacterized protein TCM_043538 [Theobroma cacao]|uniref:Uncharacterized protein n=1 Tax=Theobroma cacao TaxID=3641 RepID=A0A061FNR8_THECC|nr:Uncharacterized protein TCM_043538 [Theobroma cacao]